MKHYSLKRSGNIFITNASVLQGMDYRKLSLIVDTGSSRTLLSRSKLGTMNSKVDASSKFQRMVTASGIVDAPLFAIDSFFCFGKRIDNFEVVAYDLPRESYVDGLLGMDFMTMFDITLVLKSGMVVVK